MKSPIVGLVVFLLVCLAWAPAAPPTGRYSGFLKVTKHAGALTVATTVKAVASISSSGGLTVMLATAQGPLPDVTLLPMPSDILRTTIAGDNTCVIPGKPRPAVTPSEVTLNPPAPLFLGLVVPNGNTFRLTYTDVPANYEYLLAPLDFTEFAYFFRRISP